MTETASAERDDALATRLRTQGLDPDEFLAWAARIAQQTGIDLSIILRRYEPCKNLISFIDYLSFLELLDEEHFHALFAREDEHLKHVLGMRQSIPIGDVIEIYKVLGAGASRSHYALLYETRRSFRRMPYDEIARRAELVSRNTEWLYAWCRAEAEGAPSACVERLIRDGVKAGAETYLIHAQIELHLQGPASPDEVRRARALERKPRIAAWAILMVRELMSHGMPEVEAWKRTAVLARTQKENVRVRILEKPGYYLSRLKIRQPDIVREMERVAREPENAPEKITANVRRIAHELPPQNPTMDPLWARNVKTVHRMLDIAPHLPPDIDLEHAQAIIVHGHLNPGQKEMFSGGRYHDVEDIPSNVRNKLGERWDPNAYRRAYAFLLKTSVLDHKKRDDVGMLTPLSQITDPVGRAIAQAWHAFARQYKNTR